MRFARPLLPARQSALRVVTDRRQASRGTGRAGPGMLLGAALIGGGMIAPAAHADTPTPEQAAPAPYTITANVTLASQYRYRGLMQTDNKPAIQGGFDFTQESGFYHGNWNSNISWLSDSNSDVSAPVEMDF
ncbi:MAG TPA: TorF family putative porin, partial [Bordetella sp.]|nr:TorF family putative porin [Bordetella sp.]